MGKIGAMSEENLKIIEFFESDQQEHWLAQIKKSDWKAGAFLYRLLCENTFHSTLGESSKVLLLVKGDELVSFCTYAERDDIPSTTLSPWVGFVYTFPKHRGHRYFGLLVEKIQGLAKKEGVSKVYLSTDHVGLYEKYGFEYFTQMEDREGNLSRIYVKK